MLRPSALTSGWPVAALGDAVEFLDHMRKPITASEREPGPYPYYGANGQQDSVAKWIFDEPLILLAEDGGHFDDPRRGVAYAVSGKCWVNNHAHVLRPRAEFDLGFLKWHLAHYDLSSFVNGTTRGKLTKGAAERIPVVKPPLVEQRRIAGILDKADAIRCKRKEAVGLIEELTRSAFLEMFGDPVANPKGWPMKPLADLLDAIDSGWSPVCQARPARDDEWGVLKLGAVTFGRYDQHENKALGADLAPLPELEVKAGDVLFSRKNTYEHVAACVFVTNTRPRLLLPDLIFRFVLSKTSGLRAETLWALLSNEGMRKRVQGLAGGTAGSMPNISKERLKSVRLPVPPVALQARFAALLTKGEGARAALEQASGQGDTLFNSLVAQTFTDSLEAPC